MASDTDAHRAELAGAIGTRLEMVENRAGVGVIAGEFLGGLPVIATV
jgi:hypothetical protein